MPGKVFITGTNGLLGTNLIIELLEQGYQIKGLLRDPSKYKGPLDPGLQLIKGKMDDDLQHELVDCEFVIHVAAETDPTLLSLEPYRETNVVATLQLLQSSIKANVKKFVFVSTSTTMGFGDEADPGSEEKPMKFPHNRSWYSLSKAEAENVLLSFKDQIDIIIANPTFLIGPHDSKPNSGKIILMGLDKRIILHPPGGKSFVHVRDVAKGLVKLLQFGKNGERYLFSGHNLTYRQFFKSMTKITGKKSLLIQIPKSLLFFAGHIGNLLRKLGVRTSISTLNMQLICHKTYFSNQKSKKALDMEYQPMENTLKDAINYFRKWKKENR